MTKEDLVKEMIAEGMAEDKALALADKILAAMPKVEVEMETPAAEMDMNKPAADMDPMKTGDMSDEMKAKDARIKALETQLAIANLKAIRPAIQRACDAVKVGVGADLQKTCNDVAHKAGVDYSGRDARLFVEGMAHGLSVTPEIKQTPAPTPTKAADTKPPSMVAPPADKGADAAPATIDDLWI